jgi:hypothetical protein
MGFARRFLLFVVVLAAAGLWFSPGEARADAPVAPKGLAVVAEGDTGTAAAALARAVYADPALLPLGLDEVHARTLAGGVVAPDAPKDVRDLADTRAALHGDDAPSRSLLGSLAASLHLKGLVVVEVADQGKQVARVFVASSGAFDTVIYEADPSPPVTWGGAGAAVTWSGATAALHRAFAEPVAAPPVLTPAPLAALAPTPAPIQGELVPGASRPFYTSPWFWGAIGAAAFAGAAFYFATRDNSDPNIQLQVQVPR